MELVTLYSDIKTTKVNWLWFPYIAVGKITLVQGDPGNGKSTMITNIIAELSKGGCAPDGTSFGAPRRVIYQCSEDGLSDTIKPRLEEAGANCDNISFINEDMLNGITIDDERIRQAIIDFRPSLLVIDPIQAYLGSNSNLLHAGNVRKLMRKLGLWASTYDCAVVLVGHQNKKEGSKDLYRTFGSIDLVAAARSVLSVERDEENRNMRIVRQIKNSIGPEGKDLTFFIDREQGFRWIINEDYNQEIETELYSKLPKNKHELCAFLLKKILCNGEVESIEISSQMAEYNIGSKTLQEVKSDLGILSVRRMRKWYWRLPSRTM